MELLAHRGLWANRSEQNTLKAFEEAFQEGFGVELDLRFFKGEIVVSHDPPSSETLLLSDFLDRFRGIQFPVALNVKDDGLAAGVKLLLNEWAPAVYFGFDMSVPDLLNWKKTDMPVFARVSEFEPFPSRIYSLGIQGIWLDAFESDWWDESEIDLILSKNLALCIVSPELHGREHLSMWTTIKKMNIANSHNLMLCTDYPGQAKEFFHD